MSQNNPEEPITTWLNARGESYRSALKLNAPERRAFDRIRDTAIIAQRSREAGALRASGVLEPEQRLDMERRRLWTRLVLLIIPISLLLVFGEPAVNAAAFTIGCVFMSYGLVWGLLRYWPAAVRRGQIGLRVLDVCWLFVGLFALHSVMLRQTGATTYALDSLYVLCVVAAVATNGMWGAILLTVASSLAILLDRALLSLAGLQRFNLLDPTTVLLPLGYCMVVFVITGSTVLFLMRISGQAAARRERALSTEISERNLQLEEANEVLRARRQMTADIAHELRNPLTTITGYVDAMSDGTLQPTPERMAAIMRQTERLNRIIGDLRTLSLADVGALTFAMQPVSVVDVLCATAENYGVDAEKRNVVLRCDPHGRVDHVLGDAERLGQVLGNLVSNALRHTPSGGEVWLRGRHEDGLAVMTVEDTGEGISPEELPLVFDRFFRAGPLNKRDGAGSGLGLAIVKALIVAHGGTIAVDSELGVGTTFTIRLPVLTPVEAEPAGLPG